jgi:hypothetical protein
MLLRLRTDLRDDAGRPRSSPVFGGPNSLGRSRRLNLVRPWWRRCVPLLAVETRLQTQRH